MKEDTAILNKNKLPFVYLKPGELITTKTPLLISTILGSCAAVTMYDRRSGLSAICHGILPKCTDNKCKQCIETGKYLDCAIKKMINEYDKINIKHRNIIVKLFGGAELLKSSNQTVKKQSVGSENIETALNILKNYGLTITITDVGGSAGRRLFFNTCTGEVLLRRMNSSFASIGQKIEGGHFTAL
ncbi:Chemotaxis protein CheD [Candidatus Magnetoovum chiemensis]|nr:Chemotaxis protein CheD [Candidatus Magnetoovum chiemensis]